MRGQGEVPAASVTQTIQQNIFNSAPEQVNYLHDAYLCLTKFKSNNSTEIE